MRADSKLLCRSALTLALALAAAPVAAQGAAASYERGPCPFERADEVEGVECGFLTVPESRDAPGDRTLRLAVAVLKSTGEAPAPDPIVLLSGGPGDPLVRGAARVAQNPLFRRLRERRDLVLFDQRGTGYSEPALCPELGAAFSAAVYGGGKQSEREPALAQAAAGCSAALRAQDVDLAAYTSAASARDLDDLRRALGHGPWNLAAVSYGTRVALEALRTTPEGIRSALLDSTVPPDTVLPADDGERFSGALRLVFDRCAADARCRAAFPDLEDDFYDVIEELQAQPMEVTLADTSRFPEGRAVVHGALWAQGVFQGLYDPSFVSVLPLFVRETKLRNQATLATAASRIAPPTINAGLRHAVLCREAMPPATRERIDADRRRHPRLGPWFEALRDTSPAICDAWGVPHADAAGLGPVWSDVPTLLVAGELDPITPPANARRVAATLSRATVVEARGLSHGPSVATPCTRDLVVRFFDAPDRPLDASCAEALPDVTFVTDVHLNRGVAKLASALRGRWGAVATLGSILLVLLSAVVSWPLAAAQRRLRGRAVPRSGRTPATARALAFATAVLVLVFFAGLARTVAQAIAANPYVLAFGVPGSAAWLFVLPWAAAASTLAVVGLAVVAWRRGWWSRAGRLHYTLVAAACAGAVVFAAGWGLLG